MTRKSIFIATLALSSITACSTMQERRLANGSYDYLDESTNQRVSIPSDLDTPAFNDEYDIPPLGKHASQELVGDKLTVISPALVLPLVSGSHIEEGLKEATVWFDQIDDSQALDTTIWNSLINFLEEQGIGVVSFDKAAQRLVTDWMIIETTEDDSWYSWTKTERSVGKRFEFSLEMKPHGRTAALKAELKDYLETVGNDVIAEIDAELERRNEIEVLNKVISHYSDQIRVADVKRIRQIRRGFPMEMGFDKDGEAAYVVDGEYDVVWPRLLLVLRKLGFNVKDLDKSNGLLFVNYGGTEAGWWDSLWSSSDGELPLEHDNYRVQVNPVGEKTSVTLLDNENKAFDVKRVTELYAEFAKVMSAYDLDI